MIDKNILKDIEAVYELINKTSQEIENGDINYTQVGEYFYDVICDKTLELLENIKEMIKENSLS